MESEALDQHRSAEELRRRAIERLNADFAPQVLQSAEDDVFIDGKALIDSLGKPPLSIGEKIFICFVASALVGIGALILANGTHTAPSRSGKPYEMVGDSARLTGVFFLSFALLFFAQIPLQSNRFKRIGIACSILGWATMLFIVGAWYLARTHA